MKIIENKSSTFFIAAIILLAALSRLLPHLPNFTPIGAIALFSGTILKGKIRFIIPLLSLVISDLFLGFYSGLLWVYSSFILMCLIGIWISRNYNLYRVASGTIFGSILFFIITNFGVWFKSGIYPLTKEGLVNCYIAAIPFFRNSFTGDIFYVSVLFFTYELIIRKYFIKVTIN
ncbi:MAG: hypothetical protein O3A55_05055 [Bacteroidetes bacterium]|nr:hypothetical protein [Bacteroidota bacterium]